MNTASTIGARDHARAQAANADWSVPAPPAGVDPDSVTWAEQIPADGYATRVLGRGTKLRLTDPQGRGCAHLIVLRAEAPWERLNVADTVKVPWQAYLGVGHPLLSDQGRVLATIVADTSSQHDTLCGASASGRALLTRGAAKHGLGPREVGPTISFFRGVHVGSDGSLDVLGRRGAGAYVELIVHLPLIVLLANAPHPLDPTPTTPLDIVAWGEPATLTQLPNTDPEYQRAVENTESAWAAAQNWSMA
ncbi:DUF1989 domain-containing protein [Skermania sp. ID1734]|uniref:DUF1989 domain-containing protein n=1 Tax=Skermania sp. ID1734 TaxID=2597516 RepID=UPI0011800715|nr:DUF1989 domain-containing protein [Skermania sp. ID1734]TSD99724.1 DUF1989 domain-containing protein [Skermania sp. ID1734]